MNSVISCVNLPHPTPSPFEEMFDFRFQVLYNCISGKFLKAALIHFSLYNFLSKCMRVYSSLFGCMCVSMWVMDLCWCFVSNFVESELCYRQAIMKGFCSQKVNQHEIRNITILKVLMPISWILVVKLKCFVLFIFELYNFKVIA